VTPRIADIAVAIATRDRPDTLRRCLEAILVSRVVPAELVVVDQGEQAAGLEGLPVRAGVRVVHVRQEPRGLSASRNEGLATSSAAIVAFTDDDCVPDPAWLEAIDRAFTTSDPPDAVTGPLLPLDQPTPGKYATASRTSLVAREFLGRSLPWDVGTGANFAAKRDALDAVGPFDVRLGVGTPARAAEDVELIYRLLSGGARIRYEPAAIMRHERVDQRKRLANRVGYGTGIGTMCVLIARRRDPYAVTILGRWLWMRLLLLGRGAARGRLGRVREEMLVLAGTAMGIARGVRVGSRS